MHNCFILKPKITLIRFHSLSFGVPLVVIHCTTRCHLLYPSLSFVVTRCRSLSLAVIRCHSLYHSLSLVVLLFATRYHSLYHSLLFAVTRCHLLSLVVTRCTTCLSFYKRSLRLCFRTKNKNVSEKLHFRFRISDFRYKASSNRKKNIFKGKMQEGTLNYYVITKCTKFGPLYPLVRTCSILVTSSPTPNVQNLTSIPPPPPSPPPLTKSVRFVIS